MGTVLQDKATLTLAGAGATGTITFKLYGPNDTNCTGTVGLDEHRDGQRQRQLHLGPTFVADRAGTYRWIANYCGDANNDATTNGCNGDNENVDVGQTTPRVTTDAGAAVTVGAAIHDSATLSNAVNPTGTITFRLYGPNDANCTGTVRSTSTATVNGNGTYQSGNFTPTAAGRTAGSPTTAVTPTTSHRQRCNGDQRERRRQQAHDHDDHERGRGRDAGQPDSRHGDPRGGHEYGDRDDHVRPLWAGRRELLGVDLPHHEDGHRQRQLRLGQLHAHGGRRVPLGSQLLGRWREQGDQQRLQRHQRERHGQQGRTDGHHQRRQRRAAGTAIRDSATLSGGSNPSGSITFKLYGPNDADCSKGAIFTDVKTISGNDTYQSGTFTPTAAGTYRWIANYGGDNSNSATSNACNAANEDVVVGKRGPTVTTDAGPNVVLGATLKDSATLAGGSSPTGKISFDLYGPNDGTCSTAIFHSETVVNGNGTYQSTGFKPSTPGTYRWIANYSGDANNNPTTNACNGTDENVDVTANAAIHIVKTGPASALAGNDVNFTLTVTNPGDQPLHNVDVTDARCDASGPTLDSRTGNGDSNLDPGEVWIYKCSAHTTAGATNLHNVSNVCGLPPAGATVCDTSPKDVPLRNPDISIDKRGPATITAGGTISYTLDVTNTGDQRFAEAKVVVTDPKCDATPVLADKNGDTSAAFLNPGETWRYTCSRRRPRPLTPAPTTTSGS